MVNFILMLETVCFNSLPRGTRGFLQRKGRLLCKFSIVEFVLKHQSNNINESCLYNLTEVCFTSCTWMHLDNNIVSYHHVSILPTCICSTSISVAQQKVCVELLNRIMLYRSDYVSTPILC